MQWSGQWADEAHQSGEGKSFPRSMTRHPRVPFHFLVFLSPASFTPVLSW